MFGNKLQKKNPTLSFQSLIFVFILLSDKKESSKSKEIQLYSFSHSPSYSLCLSSYLIKKRIFEIQKNPTLFQSQPLLIFGFIFLSDRKESSKSQKIQLYSFSHSPLIFVIIFLSDKKRIFEIRFSIKD